MMIGGGRVGIRRVSITNYKSFARTRVDLDQLTLLVGKNGSGKSNFVDALSFVRECLEDSTAIAFRNRGGLAAVRRRSNGHPYNIGISLELDLPDNSRVHYAFKIAAKPKDQSREGFRVSHEICSICHFMGEEHGFEVKEGQFTKPPFSGFGPKLSGERLALFSLADLEPFSTVYNFLTGIRRYSIHPELLREPQEPDAGLYLEPDGSNAAAVLRRLAESPELSERYSRVCSILDKVVEGVRGVEPKSVGRKDTFEFKQDVGLEHPWTFDPINMSEGTLRVLGLLLAVYQPGDASVICIEEPEATIHPAAAELLIQVLEDASASRQVIVTTHSPDILDYEELSSEQIRVVWMSKGTSQIAPMSPMGRGAIREHLYTPGELLRIDELNPDHEQAATAAKQLNLFKPSRLDIPEQDVE